MGNTRNLGDLLNADSTIATADIADGGVSTAKLADDAVTQAKIGADAVGTTELANDVAISTSGDVTTTGNVTVNTALKLRGDTGTLHFRRTTSEADIAKIEYVNGNPSLDISADGKNIRFTNAGSHGENMRLTSSGNLGIGSSNPAEQLHIDESASNSYACMRLEGSNRGGKIDMYQGSTITNQILGDQSGNLYIGSSGGYGQVAIDSQVQFSSTNKCPAIKSATFLTQFADEASRNIASNLQGLVIVTSYNLGLTCIARHEYQNAVQIISANSLWSNSDTDGKICLISGTNDYSITLKNRYGSALDFKVLMVGTVQ